MESWSWVLVPLVVALFGFLFWVIIGRASSQTEAQKPGDDQENIPSDPNATIGSGL
jgi:hypothetical protein